MLQKLRVPHTLVLLFGMILFAYTLTWLVPSGAFETVTNDRNREVVVPGTYAELENTPKLPNLVSIHSNTTRPGKGARHHLFCLYYRGSIGRNSFERCH